MTKHIKFFITFLLFFNMFIGNALAEEVLAWQDCIGEAQKNHPNLISAQESIKEKEASKAITTSGLLPQITGNASGRTAKTSTRTDDEMRSSTSDSYSYGVAGTQLIFDGFKTINDVRAASENIKAA